MMSWFLCFAVSIMVSAEVEVHQYPAKEINPVFTLDRIKTTGTYIRGLGNLSIDAGKYYVILALTPEKFEVEFQELYAKIDAFKHTYYDSIHDSEWSDSVDLTDFKNLIQQQVMSTLDILKNKISNLEEKFTDMLQAYLPPKFDQKFQKRGLFNFVGTALSYLFGTAQSSEVNNVKSDIISTKKEILQMLHANKELVSVLSLKNHQIDELESVQTTILNATKRLTSSLLAQARAFRDLKKQSIFNHMMGELSYFDSKVSLSLNNLDLHISNYFSNLQDAKLGKLNPQMVRPHLLKSILISVQSNLPSYLSLPNELDFTNLYEIYSLTHTDLVSITDKQQAIILEFLLINKNRSFKLILPTVFRMPLVEKVNATSELEIGGNVIYALNFNDNVGYNISYFNLKQHCKIWKDNYICHEILLEKLPQSQINCLFTLLNATSESILPCYKRILPQDNVSQISYLNRNKIGFSVRGNANLKVSCMANSVARIDSVINGVGTFDIPESCTIDIEGTKIHNEYNKIEVFNQSLIPDLTLSKISAGFLATNLQWENLQNATFLIDIAQLKRLENSLLHEISFQTNRSLLNNKTRDLLSRTQNLINQFEPSLIDELFHFEIPKKEEILVYVLLLIIIVVGFASYTNLRKTLKRQHEKQLKHILNLHYPTREKTV